MKRTSEIDNVISANLQRLMPKKHGSQKEIAESVGLKPGSLNQILNCKVHAGPDVVARIAKVLGVDEVEIYQIPTSKEPAPINSKAIFEYVSTLEKKLEALSDVGPEIAEAYLKLSPDDRETIRNHIRRIAKIPVKKSEESAS
ncbi:hypothetical protein CCP2SC5_1020013 [Azospirillaceae bacterium]